MRLSEMETTMFRFSILKRLPKTPLLGLAALALAVAAAAGGAAKHADAATTYNIEVTFDHVRWSAINDGLGDHTAEVYGELSADASGGGGARQLGHGGRTSSSSGWTASNAWSNKKVDVGPAFFFAQTPLTASPDLDPPTSSYAFNNNKFVVRVAPGARLITRARLEDYDAASADDNMCMMTGSFTFSDLQLQTLNKDVSLNPMPDTSTDGSCVVVVHLRRI